MLVAFSRFFLCGKAAVARFCSQDGRKRRQGASLHGFSVAFGALLAAFLPLFALPAPFRAFLAASRRFERPHSRVFCQPGKKTLQRGPLAAFSAAELLFAWVDSARVLSAGSLAHPGPRADWRLCWSRVRGCLSLRASLLIRFAFRLIRLANLLNARSV